MSLNLILQTLRLIREKCFLFKQRVVLKNKNFSIISSNCWGGSVYEDLNLPYRSPTVGLFFYTPCFIKFISDLESNLKEEIVFTNCTKYDRGKKLLESHPYPIGLIKGEIEIHFLHYTSEKDARDKWIKRAERINYNNMILSLTDNDICTLDELEAFDALPYKKVFFSSKEIDGIKSLVHLKCYEGRGSVGNLYANRWHYRNYFDIIKWLNA